MECLNCGKQLIGQQKKYCSRGCNYQFYNNKKVNKIKVKVCPECGRDFQVSIHNKIYCSKECYTKFSKRKYYQNNKDKWSECWKKRTTNRRIKQFGINEEKYNKMVEKVNNRCEICGKHTKELKKSLCIDHDHNTGKIRGLLCSDCNVAIGRFKDNINSIKNAIKYLTKA